MKRNKKKHFLLESYNLNEPFNKKITLDWLRYVYDYANKKLFGGQLPPCFIRFEPCNNKINACFTWLNKAKCDKNGRLFVEIKKTGKKIYINKSIFFYWLWPVILINQNKFYTKGTILNTLIHEMCHYYTLRNGYMPQDFHGPEFYSIANHIKEKTNYLVDVLSCNELKRDDLELNADYTSQFEDQNGEKEVNYFIVCDENNSIKLFRMKDELFNDIIKQGWPYKNTTFNKPWAFALKLKNNKIYNELYSFGYKQEAKSYHGWPIKETDLAYTVISRILKDRNNFNMVFTEQ